MLLEAIPLNITFKSTFMKTVDERFFAEAENCHFSFNFDQLHPFKILFKNLKVSFQKIEKTHLMKRLD